MKFRTGIRCKINEKSASFVKIGLGDCHKFIKRVNEFYQILSTLHAKFGTEYLHLVTSRLDDFCENARCKCHYQTPKLKFCLHFIHFWAEMHRRPCRRYSRKSERWRCFVKIGAVKIHTLIYWLKLLSYLISTLIFSDRRLFSIC